MNASELMIGDHVFFLGHVHQIRAIEHKPEDNLSTIMFYGKNKVITTTKEVEPIPLTAEILEKNGWKDWFEHSTIARSVSVLVEDNTSLCIQEIKGQDSMFVQISHCGAGTFEFRKHLKYVHELQHALRLCGIDKEIVL